MDVASLSFSETTTLLRQRDASQECIRPLADTDFIIAAVPYGLLRRLHGPLSREMTVETKNWPTEGT